MQRRFLAALSFALWLAVPGCSEDKSKACTPGKSEACIGVGGCAGGQVCDPSGEGFGACVCAAADVGVDAVIDSTSPMDSVAETAAETGDAGPCDLVAQSGCAMGEKCMAVASTAEPVHTCVPAGTVAEGAACMSTSTGDNCLAGLACLSGQCRKYCDVSISTTCSTNFVCTDYAVGAGKTSACTPRCDPVTQVRLTDGAPACGSTDPSAPNRGCYGSPNGDFTCAPAISTKKHGDEPLSGSTGTPFLNGCAPGYAAVFKKSSDPSSPIVCQALCRPGETHKTSTANAGGVSPNTCAARGAAGAECRYWWFVEDESRPKTAESNTVGFCVNYANYTYDHDMSATTAPIPWPSCTTLANTDTNADGIADNMYFGCGPRP